MQVTLTFGKFENYMLLATMRVEERTQLIPELVWTYAEFYEHLRAPGASLWVVEDDYANQVQGFAALRKEGDQLVVVNMASMSGVVMRMMRVNVIAKAREYGVALQDIVDRTPNGWVPLREAA
jgi:hypothetical protein